LSPPRWGAGTTQPAVQQLADNGIDIVHIPPRGPETPPGVSPPRAPAQPQARLLRIPVRLGSQPNEEQKGWIGVTMEALELPLALSLGLANGDGAFILNTSPGGPAAQAGLRLGDIVVALNGEPLATMNDLRQRVAAKAPGSEIVLDVRRVAGD